MKQLMSLLALLGFSTSTIATEADFWAWFVQNRPQIEALTGEQDPIIDQLLAQLHRYNQHLFLELSTNSDHNELVITAEGDAAHFDSVRTLIAKAPTVKHWTFTALRPPLGFAFKTTYEGVEYDPAQLWFLPLENKENPSAVGLRIGIAHFDEKTHLHANAAAWVMLDTGLGEQACAEDIQYVETGALPAEPEKAGYIELAELPEYLKWVKGKAKSQ